MSCPRNSRERSAPQIICPQITQIEQMESEEGLATKGHKKPQREDGLALFVHFCALCGNSSFLHLLYLRDLRAALLFCLAALCPQNLPLRVS
jgi:hypothetical protein